MPEGLSVPEVGKEIGEHAKHANEDAEHAAEGEGKGTSRHARRISIAEAVLLSIVTLLAAWSGYSAAKWGTHSSLKLAKAAAARTEASRNFQEAQTFRSEDASMFTAWFLAYELHDASAMRVARKRFRPQYRVAFDAWLATHPFTNPNAPPGPQNMPQYHPSGAAQAPVLEARASALYAQGERAANTSDEYVRITVILASVLFLVGISTQFPLPAVRYGLLTVGGVLLIFAVEQMLSLPGPPA